jgi:limonene 1,2-monooxygenase
MPDVAVASSVTPSGGRAAGKYGLGMLCVAATVAGGYDALDANWRIACETAKKHGKEMNPAALRLVGPMHLASTREKARNDVRYGLGKFAEYFSKVNPLTQDEFRGAEGDIVDRMIESGRAVIGTPDDAITQLERLEKKQGHFGAFLLLAHNWAPFAATKESYELFARHVLPRFNQANGARQASLQWVDSHGTELIGAAAKAAMEAVQKHAAEQTAEAESGSTDRPKP